MLRIAACELVVNFCSIRFVLLNLLVSFHFATVSPFLVPQYWTYFQHSRHSTTATTTQIMGIKGFRSWFESQFPHAILAMNKDQASDTFDHVLIDMNQLLHIAVRKSRSDGHALTILMKELDSCVAMATPEKSLVLAMDGAPSAAKLSTQRRRRFATVLKTEYKLKQLEKLVPDGNGKYKMNSTDEKPTGRKKMNAKVLERKKRKAVSEIRTLRITPGTDFMVKAEQALLYWAWQRLSSRSNVLSTKNVRIFISPSTVAGEGEVKLLEWIYSKNRRGESIAILGGDSDLVLEGLVIPPASTHNVFVLLPDGSNRYLSVSLWETTRALHRILPEVTVRNMVKIRTDLVLLLMLNGNDYLPKLRGSSGFNKLFRSYLRLQCEWNEQGYQDQAYLVDPDTLEFNLEFCIAFFSRMAKLAPSNVFAKKNQVLSKAERVTPLQQLNNFADAGCLPSPINFQVVRGDSVEAIQSTQEDDKADEDESEVSDEDDVVDDLDDEEQEPESDLVRLMMGEPESEEFYTYELWHPKGVSLKIARHKLAAMALADLLENESDDGDEDEELGIPGLSNAGYEWEIHHSASAKVDSYLYGILWNLQTYQDGVCADYAYNYGKRASPTAREIVSFFESARKDQRSIGPRVLAPGPFNPPVSAGISCLAALPSPVKDLVPEPYCWLADETVESIYSSCMDREANVFDLKKFERLCEEQVTDFKKVGQVGNGKQMEHEGRRILMGDHYWTCISKVPKPLPHPFDPPHPFSSRLSTLKPDNRIRVSRYMATNEPCPRLTGTNAKMAERPRMGFVKRGAREFQHSDPGALVNCATLEDVSYRVAYRKGQKIRKGLRNGEIKMSIQSHVTNMKTKEASTENSVASLHGQHSTVRQLGTRESINGRSKLTMSENAIAVPDKNHALLPSIIPKTTDGLTPLACLKQLEDLEMIGPIEWEILDQEGTDLVRLRVMKATNPTKAVLFDDLVHDEIRNPNTSRQTIKQHLADLALCAIVSSPIKWSELSFKELKHRLQILKSAPKTID